MDHSDIPPIPARSVSGIKMVVIDADYKGSVFNITLADIPERKNDLVEAKKDATIAIKVTDMLGEEVPVLS